MVKAKWVMVDGKAHYFAKWDGWQAVTVCGITVPPLFREPKQHEPNCYICTDTHGRRDDERAVKLGGAGPLVPSGERR